MNTSVAYILFPGRHHLVTQFQVDYLHDLLSNQILDTSGELIECAAGTEIVWALTSATHSGTRRNPIPAHRREALIERVSVAAGFGSLVAPIADVPVSPGFAHTVVAGVEASLGIRLSPKNTVVACSTPEVMKMYEDKGFRLASVELDSPENPTRPWAVLELVAANDERWRMLAHPQTVEYFDRYRLPDAIRLIHFDPTVSTEGDLTQTRDYGTYTADFDAGSDRKWEQVAPHVQPGRVVDLGCAAGGLLERAGRDPLLAESDLFGVDVARHLIAEAEHRKAQGVFENPNTFFTQRNLLRAPVFPDASVNTTVTVALTHEISSYGNGIDDLRTLTKRIFEHTVPGGVWINSDVLGPDTGDRLVHLHLPVDGVENVGSNEVGAKPAPVDYSEWESSEVAAHYREYSPADRLRQFSLDFPRLSGGECEVNWISPEVAELTLNAAMEFLYTRDYFDNYLSECHERFCDLDYAAWCELMASVGFEIAPVSGPWRNDWLVENRLAVGTRITDVATGEEIPWPNTHILLVARRPNHAIGEEA